MEQMFERVLDQYPVATLIAVGVACLLVAAAIAVAMDWFIGQAEAEPGARRPHPLDPQNPTHCDRCWRESNRRRAAAIESQAVRTPPAFPPNRVIREGQWPVDDAKTATVTPFRAGRWPRI